MVDVSHMAQAMNGMREAFARMEGALNRVCEQLAESMPKQHPVEKAETKQFEYTDVDGDFVQVGHLDGAYDETRVIRVNTQDESGSTVHLSQTAVNELAQYLDRYRTDVPREPEADRIGQPPSHLIDTLCAGHFPDRAADKTGCDHFREVHGALGCTVAGCPCERRGGR